MPTQTSTENYTDTTRRRREQLFEALGDVEYRRAFAEDVGTGLAFQIRALRENRGWTQEQLAERMGKRQETISRWENPEYGKHTLSTLKELAAAFDLAPIARLGSFRELVDWTIQLTPNRIAPNSFASDVAALNATAYAPAMHFGTVTVNAGGDMTIGQAEMPIYQTTDNFVMMTTGILAGATKLAARLTPLMPLVEKGGNHYDLAA